MHNIMKQIHTFQPTCAQEVADKQQILTYLNQFSDVLTRKNTCAHFTSSGFIVNKEHTKVLFIHHKIFQSWCWTGGHVDGETDFLKVAVKEAMEETGLINFQPFSPSIASLDILPVFGHEKNNLWIPSHLHLSVAYILEADEQASLIKNSRETNGVQWIPFEDIHKKSTEKEMIVIYQKLLNFLWKNEEKKQ